MSSTGAIPRTKKHQAAAPAASSSLHPDTQILVGQDASEALNVKLLTVSSNGVQTRIPALHASWCCQRTLMHYSPPPTDGLEVAGALDAWLEQMDFLTEDLQWILALPHHRFWSELVYERKVHACLVSYLSQAPRWYDDQYHTAVRDTQQGQTIAPVLATVHRLVLLVHVRMTTYKESKACHINPKAFGDLLYQHYIIDLCQILDLCALYYSTNSPLLNKMVANIFTNQARYRDDVQQVVVSINTALDNVEHKLGVSETNAAVSLNSVSRSPDLEDLRAIVYYLLDTSHTLHNFVLVYPDAAQVLHSQDLHIRLAQCYERVTPALTSGLSQYPETAVLVERLEHLRYTMLAAFRSIIQAVCLTPLQDKSVSGLVVSECLAIYLHVISSCLAEKTFIADYHTTYSFTTDVDVFRERSSDVTSVQFIQEAVQGVLQEMGVHKEALTNGHAQPGNSAKPGDSSGMSHYAASGSSAVDAVQLAELLSSVQELMPDLGAGFITKCLKHYHYSSEAVINALLECSLPPALDTLDRCLAEVEDLPSPQQYRAPSPPPLEQGAGQGSAAETGYCSNYEQALDEAKLSVMNRANIYNDDEFDVFSSAAVDRSKVHRGKKKKAGLESDETMKEKVRALGHRYDERHGRSIYEDEFHANELSEDEFDVPPADYNDEYDDTYDDNEAGNMDANTEIMMPSRKAFSRPTMFGRGSLNAPLGTADAEEEDCSSAVGTTVRRALPTEENEEDFGRRRGLRKGLGGVQFMLELRENGGEIKKPTKILRDRNLPDSHYSQNNSRKHDRYLPRDHHRDHHKPLYVNSSKQKPAADGQEAANSGDEEGEEEEEEEAASGPRLNFTPFCEDPTVARQRQADRWASRDAARGRGGNRTRRQMGRVPPPQPMPVNGFDGQAEGTTHTASSAGHDGISDGHNGNSGGYRGNSNGYRGSNNSYRGSSSSYRGNSNDYRGSNGTRDDSYNGNTAAASGSNDVRQDASSREGPRPKAYTNKSGKSWRQGTDDDARGSKGGKWKEDTNHGNAQDPNHRRKMENKNKARKQAAQNKFNRNN